MRRVAWPAESVKAGAGALHVGLHNMMACSVRGGVCGLCYSSHRHAHVLQVLNLLWGSSTLRNPSAYIVRSGNTLLDKYYQEQEQREAQERSDAEMAASLMQQVSWTVYVHMALWVGIVRTGNVPHLELKSCRQPSGGKLAVTQHALLTYTLHGPESTSGEEQRGAGCSPHAAGQSVLVCGVAVLLCCLNCQASCSTNAAGCPDCAVATLICSLAC